jgi:DNA invertase Pin-like site-specific DNA recombinase
MNTTLVVECLTGASRVTYGRVRGVRARHIVERVKEGLRRATAQGKKLGRPRIEEKLEKAVLRELEKGHGIHTVARAVGVGTGTVQRIMKGAAVA